MTTGFQLRVAATCDRLSRELADLADKARIAGLSADAATVQTISDTLARLAFDAAKSGHIVLLARISSETGASARALRQAAKSLEAAGEDLELAAEAAAVDLAKLCHTALSQTQPIG